MSSDRCWSMNSEQRSGHTGWLHLHGFPPGKWRAARDGPAPPARPESRHGERQLSSYGRVRWRSTRHEATPCCGSPQTLARPPRPETGGRMAYGERCCRSIHHAVWGSNQTNHHDRPSPVRATVRRDEDGKRASHPLRGRRGDRATRPGDTRHSILPSAGTTSSASVRQAERHDRAAKCMGAARPGASPLGTATLSPHVLSC